MVEATKGVGQSDINGATKDWFFYSWFSSNNSSEDVMDVGVELISIVKTNKKILCKETF